MWIPTPDRLVTRMLQLARLTSADRLVDLGSGDGKIVIAAAREFSASGLGLEYNPDMVTLSRSRAAAAGVADRASFQQADIFQSDFGQATVVTMYLLPELNLRLRKTLFAMKPGTRVVSHQWTMGQWTPDETSRVGGVPVYLWLIPANAGGTWSIEYPVAGQRQTSTLTLAQQFQRLTKGEVDIDGIRNSVRDAQLEGDRIRFAFTDSSGVLRRFDGLVDGATMRGTISGSDNSQQTFSARRIGPAPPIPGSTSYSDEEASLGAAELGG